MFELTVELVIEAVPVVAAFALAAVLAVAAKAKVGGTDQTTADFESLGLIGAPVLARLIPAVEALTAVTLVVAPPFGGPLTFSLLAGFTVVLWRARSFGATTGQPVSCACFGAVDSGPVSVRHLIRNAVLMALALAATTTSWTALTLFA